MIQMIQASPDIGTVFCPENLLRLNMPQIVLCLFSYISQASPAAPLARLSLVARLGGPAQVPAQWVATDASVQNEWFSSWLYK